MAISHRLARHAKLLISSQGEIHFPVSCTGARYFRCLRDDHTVSAVAQRPKEAMSTTPDLSISWLDSESRESYINHSAVVQLCDRPDQREPSTSSHATHELVESFCLNEGHVVVSYDGIPLRSASISVSVPVQMRAKARQFVKPTRVHYGFSTTSSNQWVGTPQDSYFRKTANEIDTFQAELDLHECEASVLGLSFVLQLEDGTWVKNRFGEDFYVGGSERRIPCVVEIPFPLPLQAESSSSTFLSLHRTNPFWLQPSFLGKELHNCEEETQFVLGSFSNPNSKREQLNHAENEFLVLLPLIDIKNGIRGSLFGVSKSHYCGIRLETGRCVPLQVSDVRGITVCVAVFAGDPYDAVRGAVELSSTIVTSFSSRFEKLSNRKWPVFTNCPKKGILNSLGYCTWDSYGHEVCQSVLVKTLRFLAEDGILLGYMIVDDGWQAGGDAGPNFEHSQDSRIKTGRPTLSSFEANEKFSRSLLNLSSQTSVEILAWVAIIGYWGGSSGHDCDVETLYVRGALALGLHLNKVEDTAFWEKDYEIVHLRTEALESYFEKYFVQSLGKVQGVSGVKIDAQSILEILCNPLSNFDEYYISRVSATNMYRNALQKAAEKAFPSSVAINSMACGPETIFCSGKNLTGCNLCWRTSNDHAFPGVEENADSVSWHILCNAMTSVFLGDVFPVVDWDMFRASDRFGNLHAVARVISGGPIYFSDAVPFDDEFSSEARTLLKSLTTHDGRILRCHDPGRPTLDCLFADPRSFPTKLLKIFNRNAILGLLGIFNLDPRKDSEDTCGSFRPSDVVDFARRKGHCQYLSLIVGSSTAAFFHDSFHHPCEMKLPGLSSALVHICPIFRISAGIEYACLGQPHMLNAGASLMSISVSTTKAFASDGTEYSKISIELCLSDHGITYVWLGENTKQLLRSVFSLCEEEVDVKKIIISKVPLLAILVPPSPPWGLVFQLERNNT